MSVSFFKGAALAAALAMVGSAPVMAQSPEGLKYAEIPASAYAVVAEVRAKPGKAAALREITLPLVTKVRHEPNNLLYFLHEDRETPGYFVFYEIFASQADFEAHNRTQHVQAWFAQLPDLVDGGVKVTRLKVLGNDLSTQRFK